MNDETLMPFGKYRGAKMADVPASYLLWLWDNGVWREKDRDLHKYIVESWTALLADAKDYIPEHQP
jgi:hypothetical protein